MNKEGFIVDSGGKRLARSMGENKCRLGCIYCFVDLPGYQKFDRVDSQEGIESLSYVIEKGNIKVIQPACDVEIFLVRNWEEVLWDLADFGLPISFATKFALSQRSLEQLKFIDDKLKEKGAFLNIAVSLVRLNNWREIEKFTPSPERRVQTARRLWEAGISVTIALRPTLPFVPLEEFEEIIQKTVPFCDNFITGPLYLTSTMKEYMDEKYPGYKVELVNPSWMKGRPEIEAVNTDGIIAWIREICARYSKPCFDHNIEAVEYSASLRRK